jgi:hypothetical protein
MALIVEDGTGKSDAESYISAADAGTYHTARGNAAWAAVASDTVREQLLRKATDYMVASYRERWDGYRKTTTQALDWPRYEVPIRDSATEGVYAAFYSDTEVPAAVARACAELALRAIDGDLAEDLDIPVVAESIGPISVSYAEGGRRQTKVFRAVDAMLAPFFKSYGGMLKVSRA